MCSFGQLFSSLNIILISLELKIIGESCVIIRLNIMTVNWGRFRPNRTTEFG